MFGLRAVLLAGTLEVKSRMRPKKEVCVAGIRRMKGIRSGYCSATLSC